MLNPNLDPNNDPNNPPADPNNPPTDPPPELTPQQMLDALIEARGGIPQPAEDEQMSEREQAMAEQIFRMETRNMLQDMQKVVDTKIPDATDQQSYAVAEAMTKGDLSDVIDAVLSAQKHAQEIDDKNEDLKNLHVEGGASGKDEDKGNDLGMAGVFTKMAQTYSKPA